MRRIYLLVGSLLAVFFANSGVYADTSPIGPVIINEIMWDGDEYIELFNPTDQLINLQGWQLTRQAPQGEVKTTIQFGDDEQIAAGGYYLVAKKETAVTVPVQKVVSNLALVNTGEQIKLLTDTGTISDVANPVGAWVAGANTTSGQSMERNQLAGDGTLATNWHTAAASSGGRDGSPGVANSVPTPTPSIRWCSSSLFGDITSLSHFKSSFILN